MNSSTQVIDHSFASTILACPRKHFHAFEQHLSPLEESIPMVVGSAMHKALAVLYKRGFNEVEAAITAMESYLEEKRLRLPPTGTFDYITAGHLRVVLENYVDHWGTKEVLTVSALVEEPVVAPLEIDGAWQHVGGIPDLIVRDGGVALCLDHKCTTSYIGANLYNRLKFSHQFRIYCLLMETLLGEPVRGAIANAIYIGKGASTPTSKATRFERWRFDYSLNQLNETKEWLLASKNLLSYYRNIAGENELKWPQNPSTSCGWCQFAPLCEVPDVLRPVKVRTLYTVRRPEGVLLSGADDDN